MNNINKVLNVKLKMNWDDDIDFLANKKHVPKQGRRAGLTNTPDSTENLLENALETIGDTGDVPVRTRKSGGWADEGTKSAKGSKGGSNMIEQERFQDVVKINNDEDDDDDIPVIPDIDEIQDNVMSMQDIKASNVTINKATYKELDSELISQQSSQTTFDKLDNINLSILTKRLYPEEAIKESKEVWTMDSLFDELFVKKSSTTE